MVKPTNFRDISPQPTDIRAGFQFEFVCDSCGESWRSPFKPYRAGQATGVFRRIAGVFGEFYKIGAITDVMGKVQRASGTSIDQSSRGARQAALEEAQTLAEDRYHRCPSCKTTVCDNCWNEGEQLCIRCLKTTADSHGSGASSASALVCPNCQTPSQGGRFCHDCGFDMASTHKSCPSCGATMNRSARFCTDCGHGF